MMATELLLSQKLTMPSVCGNRCSFVFICLQHCSGACRVVRTCIHIHTHTNMHIHTDVLMCICIYTYRERGMGVWICDTCSTYIYIHTHAHVCLFIRIHSLVMGPGFLQTHMYTGFAPSNSLSLHIYIYIDL